MAISSYAVLVKAWNLMVRFSGSRRFLPPTALSRPVCIARIPSGARERFLAVNHGGVSFPSLPSRKASFFMPDFGWRCRAPAGPGNCVCTEQAENQVALLRTMVHQQTLSNFKQNSPSRLPRPALQSQAVELQLPPIARAIRRVGLVVDHGPRVPIGPGQIDSTLHQGSIVQRHHHRHLAEDLP